MFWFEQCGESSERAYVNQSLHTKTFESGANRAESSKIEQKHKDVNQSLHRDFGKNADLRHLVGFFAYNITAKSKSAAKGNGIGACGVWHLRAGKTSRANFDKFTLY